jgi:type I restriction enzyme S subunit
MMGVVMNDIPKGYKQTDVGLIPEDWGVLPLGRLIHSVEYGSAAKSSATGRVPVLRMGNLQGGKIDWDDLVYTDNELEIRKYSLVVGDVLFNRTNTIDLVGKTAIYKGERAAVFAGYLIRINSDKALLDSAYLNYILNAEFSRKHSAKILSIAVGQANINGQKLKSYPVPLPPTKAEQEAIAEALSDADALIESLEQLLAKKRQIKQGAMQELLTGKKRLPGFSGEWEVKRLGKLGEFLKGKGVTRDQAQSGTLPCIRYGEIYTTHRDYIRAFQSWISAEVASTATRLRSGDVLFAGSGETKEEIGKCVAFVGDREAYAGGDIVILRPRDIDPLFFGYAMNTPSVNRQKASLGQGDAVVHISAAALADVSLPVPEKPEQTAIAEVLSDMDAEIAALEAKLAKARRLKQGMMQELLTGRIRLV